MPEPTMSNATSRTALWRLRRIFPTAAGAVTRTCTPNPAGILVLLALLALLLLTRAPAWRGDFTEYALTTVALAEHATPDIRPSDVDFLARHSTDANYRTLLAQIRTRMQAGEQVPVPGLYKSLHGRYLAIHFFAYPALAALPFRLIGEAGGNPFKAFQVVNALAFSVVGLGLFAFLRSSARAGTALVLFMLSGGVLYVNWCSPEMFTACALLAGLLLCALQRPFAAAVLTGLAAMQNPPLIVFSVLLPLFCMAYAAPARPGLQGWRAAIGRYLPAAALQFGLACVPFVFCLWQFGVPSVIAKFAADPHLVSLTRFGAYYLDPSQGMIVAVPTIPLLAAYGLLRERTRSGAAVLGLTLVLMLGLALPSLSTTNWNSDAVGVMRYAFWGAAPLLFLAFAGLRTLPRWPWIALGLVLVVQAAAMHHATRYSYTEFSPAARFLLDHAPALYDPEPEIFVERRLHGDGIVDAQKVVTWPEQGPPSKVLFYANNQAVHRLLCGPGRAIPDATPLVEMPRGWRYLTRTGACEARREPLVIDSTGFDDPARLQRVIGWSALELGGGEWNGMWTDGPVARLRIPASGDGFSQLLISGHYLPSVYATRVLVNGRDLGRMDLAAAPAIPLPRLAPGQQTYEIELRHEVSAPPPGPETRRLGFFLTELILR